MGMAAILINGQEQFEQIVNILLSEESMWNLVKTVQAVSEICHLKISQFYKCI